MKDIAKIVIKGCSGYCAVELAYSDELTITPTMMEYVYTPVIESEMNSSRRWSYKTNSPLFAATFGRISDMMQTILNPANKIDCTDIGMIDFTATYTDKSTKHIRYWCPSEEFSDCFSIIRALVPRYEMVPKVIR